MFPTWLNARYSESKNKADNFMEKSIPFGDFSKVLQSEINYSPFIYTNNYRLEANSKLSDCNMIILDFDEGLTIEDAKEKFSKWVFILATTKSHQKQKDKKAPCDRFRIVLPTETAISCTVQEYKTLMRFISEQSGCDPACIDIARFYYGYKDAEIYYHESDYLFDWEDTLYKANKYNEIIKWKESKTKERQVQIEFDSDKGEYLKNNYCNERFLRFFDFENKFHAKGRNNYLYSVGRCLIDSGFNQDDTENAIFWINSNGDGLSQHEIISTVFRSLRRFY